MGGGEIPPYPTPSINHSDPSQLHAVVDLGSNGIRCSVTDLSARTARILPTQHMHRVNIALYDAQYDDSGKQIPIPSDVIDAVVAAITRFQMICVQLQVPAQQLRIVATEATRHALNGADLVDAIERATTRPVEILSKGHEGVVGAWGIASGFSDIQGLAIDLGGGSMQITWLIAHAGHVQMSPHRAVSFPYGAAALTQTLRRLKQGKSESEARRALDNFRAEMEDHFRDAFRRLAIPAPLRDHARRHGGFDLYLSGGGFRGWGYLLLYLHQIHPDKEYYPISIINGYSAPHADFADTDSVERAARTADRIFRVSDRRRAQVPSVAFLVNALAAAVPHGIRAAHFCQGGVREGLLFRTLPPVVRQQDPLQVATEAYARPSVQALLFLLLATIPPPTTQRRFPRPLSGPVLQAFANSLYLHAAMSKELASTAALYSTSAGPMAAAHGIPHADRARLALLLQARHGGALPPRERDFRRRLRALLPAEEVWWTRYLGGVGLVIAALYPVGIVDPAQPRVLPTARWSSHLGKRRNKEGLELVFRVQRVDIDPSQVKNLLEGTIHKIRKVGKRKHWVGGRDGWGMKVGVEVEVMK
ncbi:Ppx-GppA-domain-containing protein [Aspergillus taichungensis]|uniref:Ppx-GppA-domain-containing protein n=1 Tax=Aspergillus taichungensis TaxID=482145 RepID=A0A2J5HR61_9EURO|nr:Ppx-GppA-domain-containing protein [Aspergillus taichungensis]